MEVMETNRNAVVQLFAYDEPGVRSTLDKFASLDPPQGWSIDYEAWVTPTKGRYTAREVENHHTFVLNEAPEGKLSSRNMAHNSASRRGYDAIILADADEPPLKDDYYAQLLRPLEREDVVAVSGFPKDTSWAAPVMDTIRRLDQLTAPIRGNTSSMLTAAWGRAGPFRTDVLSEKNISGVRQEEEFDFRRRLEAVGEVVDNYDAQTKANNRRNVCVVQDATNPFGESDMGYCGRRGAETFAPAEDERGDNQ